MKPCFRERAFSPLSSKQLLLIQKTLWVPIVWVIIVFPEEIGKEELFLEHLFIYLFCFIDRKKIVFGNWVALISDFMLQEFKFSRFHLSQFKLREIKSGLLACFEYKNKIIFIEMHSTVCSKI